MTGIRTIEDIRQRCVIDEDTGCWSWRMCTVASRGGPVPMAWIPAGVLGDGARLVAASRAAWLLSGRKIAAGHIVWRCCGNKLCINPLHCRSTSKAAHGRWIAEQGHTRGAHRAVASRKATAARAASPELVAAIEADIGAGMSRADILARHDASARIYYAVLAGRHQHQRGRLVPGASVFAMAGVR